MMTDLTMYQALKEAANKYPSDLALYYQGRKISFRTLLKRVDMTADILYHRLGVREKDVIVIAQPNIPETIVLFYAVNKIGATSNLIHPFTPFNQVKQIIDKTHTKVAFLFEQRIAKEVDRYREIAEQVYVTRIEDDLPLFSKFIYHNFMNFRIRKKLGKLPARFKFDGFKYTYELKPTGKDVPTALPDKNRCSVLLHTRSPAVPTSAAVTPHASDLTTLKPVAPIKQHETKHDAKTEPKSPSQLLFGEIVGQSLWLPPFISFAEVRPNAKPPTSENLTMAIT